MTLYYDYDDYPMILCPRMIATCCNLSSPKHFSSLSSTRCCSRSSSSIVSVCRLWFGSDLNFSNGGYPRVSTDVRFHRSSMNCLRRMGGGCFRGGYRNGPTVELDSGGDDVLDAAAADSKVSPVHLVIMVNGIVGSSADWKYAAEQFVEKIPDKVIVHRSECNYSKLTFDGVDLMGDRLAQEVLAVVRRRPGVRKISFVAHSLGGLIARYAVARLYEKIPKSDSQNISSNSINHEHSNPNSLLGQPYEDRIAGLEPMNFITFATPHLGSRGHKQLPFLCGLPFLEKRAPQTAHLIVGRTGKHLFLTDNDEGKPPLLLRMVNDDSEGLQFISALRAFKRRVAYANANFDHMVGWRTSSIRRQHELPKPNLLITDQSYPHIVYVEQGAVDSSSDESSLNGDKETDLEEEMIKGLTQVPWERVDVSFYKSRQRYVAHSTIQVKTYWLNSDGADVIFHMIDNFLI